MTEKNMSRAPGLRLGLDVGALYVKSALLDSDNHLIFLDSREHKGDVLASVAEVLSRIQPHGVVKSLGLVGSNAQMVAELLQVPILDQVNSTIIGVGREFAGVRQIIDIGGGSLSLTRLSSDGRFSGFETNTLCAAGTGSFLDEQAARLGISYDSLQDMPLVESPPSIAARCAVFAKSDLIHRQQEGHSIPELWSGLCAGLARTIIMTLFKGRTPQGRTVVVGGVARNQEVMRHLAEGLGVEVLIPEHPMETTAFGAALEAVPVNLGSFADLVRREVPALETRKPLVLTKTSYPSFEVLHQYVDQDGNEVRVSSLPDAGDALSGYLGIDVGSTSTKLVLMDDSEQVLVDIYRKTGGDPIKATRLLLGALVALAGTQGRDLRILGVGTTGSGRKLVAEVLMADAVINEITAHVTGAMKTDPSIDTIFEIGGQDAKYIHTVGGNLHNSNMNYVCAAGTGSFVEELCRKLDFDLTTVGEEVLGVSPPLTSDRCTVFMEQDARTLLRKGIDRREVMGSILYSVVQNYLNKVVGTRHISKKKVFFQGATARNRGLVAAFENLLDVEVVVSPYCHVMGSLGVAILTRRQLLEQGRSTRFIGLEVIEREVTVRQDECTLCANRCTITHTRVQGDEHESSWGYLCGRDPEESQVKATEEFALFKLRERLWRTAGDEVRPSPQARVIGMPRALLTFSYYPLWRRFFARLGYKLKLSRVTSRRTIDRANDWVGGDYCFPVKLAHGHCSELLEDPSVDLLFIPYMVSAGQGGDKTSASMFCPYNIGLPAMISSAMYLNGVDGDRMIRATVDFRWDLATAARRLAEDLADRLEVSQAQVRQAWSEALDVQKAFEKAVQDQGGRRVQALLEEGRQAVVVLGRPYNVFDSGANLELPMKLARLGIPVIPLDALPLDQEEIGDEFYNMFWNFGRRILEGARLAARTPNLNAVYFSNFSCGPDSFIQNYVEHIMGDKPMLMLELDEHAADAGYLTRIEAFADVLRASRIKESPVFKLSPPPGDMASVKDKTLWIPPMHECATPFVAAVLRGAGLKSEPLPPEDLNAFELGRASSRGGECLPCPATLGTFFKTIGAKGDPENHALFMPTAEGPCRFGQYCTHDRLALDRRGWTGTPIVSWNSTDSYDGLDARTRRRFWSGLVLADALYKVRCRILPYEIEEGATEAMYLKWKDKFVSAFEHNDDLDRTVRDARDDFLSIRTEDRPKPLVGVVGEIYVRHNPFCNQDVVRRIERAGGEAWMAPISEWIIYTAHMEGWFKGFRAGGVKERLTMLLKNRFLARDEQRWTRAFDPILRDRMEPPIGTTISEGLPYFPMDFEGEAIITVGRAIEFMKQGAALVVNCAPFGCMPGSMTTGVFQEVEVRYGVPVANMFYDGEGDINTRIDTFISNLAAARRSSMEKAESLG